MDIEKLFKNKKILVVGDGNVNSQVFTDNYDLVIMFNRLPNYDKVNRCDVWFVDVHNAFFDLANIDKLRKANVHTILIPHVRSKDQIDRFCELLPGNCSKIHIINIDTYTKCGNGVFTTTYLYLKFILQYAESVDVIGIDIKNRYNILSKHPAFINTWHVNALKDEEIELSELINQGRIHEC